MSVSKNPLPPPPGNNVVILDVMTLCNHLIMKAALVGEERGGEGRGGEGKLKKVHIKTENVPTYQEFCPRL